MKLEISGKQSRVAAQITCIHSLTALYQASKPLRIVFLVSHGLFENLDPKRHWDQVCAGTASQIWPSYAAAVHGQSFGLVGQPSLNQLTVTESLPQYSLLLMVTRPAEPSELEARHQMAS